MNRRITLAPARTRAVGRTRSRPERGTAVTWAGTSGATASRASDEVEGTEQPVAALTLDWSTGCLVDLDAAPDDRTLGWWRSVPDRPGLRRGIADRAGVDLMLGYRDAIRPRLSPTPGRRRRRSPFLSLRANQRLQPPGRSLLEAPSRPP